MVEQIKHAYGFDRPLPVQFLLWLGHVLTGDFGMSISTRRPVILEVTGALSNTVHADQLRGAARVLTGYAMGALAGCFPGRAVDRIVTGAAVVGVSLPNYWLGIVLVIVFAVELMALPATGMGRRVGAVQPPALERRAVPDPAGRHAVDDPGRHPVAHDARRGRRGANQDFVTDAARQGPGRIAVIRHVLKNSAPQVLAVMGLQFGYLMGGSILVETVFTWPGSGFMLSKAIINRDIPVLQGTILFLAMIFVATNLVVDLLQSMIDPRIRALSWRRDVADRHASALARLRRRRAAGTPRPRLLESVSATGCATIR